MKCIDRWFALCLAFLFPGLLWGDATPQEQTKPIVINHVTRRTGIRRAKTLLRKRIGDDQMARVLFLMDFEGAREAGEVEDVGPPPADTAE